ncbi:MAG: two-component system, NarL family, sensor histidine kinase UhpB [Chthoniobacter sp.]|jgi:PAS domain S-box-containing protein|nr:two-component system, NarL family, sensor histidine kinase UhpB [Chthoniobacter sp.]
MPPGAEETKSRNTSRRRARDYEESRLLKESEWLRVLPHISPVAIFRANAAGECIYCNERLSELSGLPAAAALGAGWERSIHPEDLARVREEWARAVAAAQPMRSEYRFLHRNGRVVWVFNQVVPDLDGGGRATGYIGCMTDITELRRMREELQKANAELEERMRDRTAELQRMARLVAASDDAIISSTLDGRIDIWNRGAERLFGYTAAEMIGQTSLVLTPPELREEALCLKARVRAGEDVHHYETVRVAKSGEIIEVSLSVLGLRDAAGTINGTSAIIRDITERKRAERRLRRLSWRLLRMQDDERRRLARELHDSTAQTLAAICMNLSALANEEAAPSEARRRELLADALHLAEGATTELRSTAYLLHPPLLDERGLCAALRWYVNGFTARSRIVAELDLPPDLGRLAPEVEMTLFRVVQESLLNVLRHSGSPTVSIHLRTENGTLILEVRDRGRGLPAQDREVLGVGIAGMKERLLQLGGRLEITPNEPGTAVIARLPRTL